MRVVLAATAIGALVACGPSSRPDPGSGGADAMGMGSNGGPGLTGPENTPAACSDGIDNDGDGLVDCADPDCSGIGMCPVCGMVEHPTGAPVDLPDGVGGVTCTTNADCTAVTPGPQYCFDLGSGQKECRQTYTSKVHFGGFGPTQKFMQPSDIVSVCVNMSHEWIRDLEIDLVAPSGETVSLDKFEGQQCPLSGACEVYLGNPVNTDGDCPGCTAEMGMQYCWTPAATKPSILGYADQSGAMMSWNAHDVEPPDNYQASDAWAKLIGATLNGDWQLVVVDLWPADAGKLHSWTIAFNPAIVQDCSGPVIQ